MKTEERRQLRIKQTRTLIRTKGLSGLLNNTKWIEVFEWIDYAHIAFDIKLLSKDKIRHCNFIRELEKTSVLIDDTGDFIEFLEIDLLIFKQYDKVAKHFDNLKVEYINRTEELIIQGYR